MKRKLMLILVVVMTAFLIVGPVQAKGPGGIEGPPGWSHINPGNGGTGTPGGGGK
jgi:hypothetical protein